LAAKAADKTRRAEAPFGEAYSEAAREIMPKTSHFQIASRAAARRGLAR
jgi:hypothetical protein